MLASELGLPCDLQRNPTKPALGGAPSSQKAEQEPGVQSNWPPQAVSGTMP